MTTPQRLQKICEKMAQAQGDIAQADTELIEAQQWVKYHTRHENTYITGKYQITCETAKERHEIFELAKIAGFRYSCEVLEPFQSYPNVWICADSQTWEKEYWECTPQKPCAEYDTFQAAVFISIANTSTNLNDPQPHSANC